MLLLLQNLFSPNHQYIFPSKAQCMNKGQITDDCFLQCRLFKLIQFSEHYLLR